MTEKIDLSSLVFLTTERRFATGNVRTVSPELKLEPDFPVSSVQACQRNKASEESSELPPCMPAHLKQESLVPISVLEKRF